GLTPSLSETRVASRPCGSIRLQAAPILSGLDRPVGLVAHRTDADVFLVLLQDGRVRVLRDGRIDSGDFLDLSDQVSTGSEGGLLGLAFAPDFAGSGRLFVSFTDRSGHVVIARFQRAGSNAFRADPDSRFDLRWPNGDRFISYPLTRSYGGHLAFGPDGLLY